MNAPAADNIACLPLDPSLVIGGGGEGAQSQRRAAPGTGLHERVARDAYSPAGQLTACSRTAG